MLYIVDAVGSVGKSTKRSDLSKSTAAAGIIHVSKCESLDLEK